ncbi:hypothetical protein MMC10_005589 [Thelotrema lepadinum]|nr:hypothetical protein [Thelotrema lepadinum]
MLPFRASPSSTLTASAKLFTGNGNAWLAHLRAAMTMYQQGHKENYLRYGLTETTRKIICEDVPLPQYEPLLAEEVVNFRFLSGTIIWLDIISAITAGTAPYLLHRHTSVIASNSQTQLENLMGCQNWVMLQIGRIAALHRQKTQALQQAHFDCTELELIVSDISREIQSGLTQGALESFNVSELDSATAFYTTSDPSTLVTNVFAYMASVYLHLVTHGFQRLEELDATMFRAMRTLQSQVSIHLLPALVLPLYIIGSVAKQGDRQFFRNAFSSAPLLDPIFEHRRRVLPILEEIWARSQITPGFSWQDSLELTNNLLLL